MLWGETWVGGCFYLRAYAIRPHAVMCMASYILSVKTEYPDPVRKS